MLCTNCGKEVSENANVCGYCGHRLKSTPKPVSFVSTQPPPQTDPITHSSVIPKAVRSKIETSGKALDWGYKNLIIGALIWTIAYLIVSLAWAIIIYITDPSLESRWDGVWKFYIYAYGSIPWLGSFLIWGMPGALAGGTRQSGIRMLWGFVSIPLGIFLGMVGIVAGSQFPGFIVLVRQGLDIAPALGAFIVIWNGLHITIPSRFPSILRWILLAWCGIIVGIWSMQILSAAFAWYNNTYAPIFFALAGMILAVYIGVRERKHSAIQ